MSNNKELVNISLYQIPINEISVQELWNKNLTEILKYSEECNNCEHCKNKRKIEIQEENHQPKKRSKPVYENCIICKRSRVLNQRDKTCKTCKITINKKAIEEINNYTFERT